MKILYSFISLAVLVALASLSFGNVGDFIKSGPGLAQLSDVLSVDGSLSLPFVAPQTRKAPSFGNYPNNAKEIIEVAQLGISLELSNKLIGDTARALATTKVFGKDGELLLSQERTSNLSCPVIEKITTVPVTAICPPPIIVAPAHRLTCYLDPEKIIETNPEYQKLSFSFDSPVSTNSADINRQVFNSSSEVISENIIAKGIKPGSSGVIYDRLPGAGSVYTIYTITDNIGSCSFMTNAAPVSVSAGGGTPVAPKHP
ncbi:MAG: hypothetical protein Q8Q37_02175 [bacterium]|nr:hypothetical protein [bacterium]